MLMAKEESDKAPKLAKRIKLRIKIYIETILRYLVHCALILFDVQLDINNGKTRKFSNRTRQNKDVALQIYYIPAKVCFHGS